MLQDGDTVTVIKDLKVKGSSSVVKVGTKVKNIRLVDGDHDIDCRIEGIGADGAQVGVREEDLTGTKSPADSGTAVSRIPQHIGVDAPLLGKATTPSSPGRTRLTSKTSPFRWTEVRERLARGFPRSSIRKREVRLAHLPRTHGEGRDARRRVAEHRVQLLLHP